jgi:hypothetical protein
MVKKLKENFLGILIIILLLIVAFIMFGFLYVSFIMGYSGSSHVIYSPQDMILFILKK